MGIKNWKEEKIQSFELKRKEGEFKTLQTKCFHLLNIAGVLEKIHVKNILHVVVFFFKKKITLEKCQTKNHLFFTLNVFPPSYCFVSMVKIYN